MQNALGLMECIGYATAMTSADAALKAAGVKILGIETVIGISGKASVTVKLEGDVAAVAAAVSAGENQARRIGEVVAVHIIPRPHEQTEKVICCKKTAGPGSGYGRELKNNAEASQAEENKEVINNE